MIDQTFTSNHGRELSRCSILALRSNCAALIAAAVTLVLSSSQVFAETVTLRFDATVDQVFGFNTDRFPFEFAQGDSISGRFTFEPGPGETVADNAITAKQLFKFEFRFASIDVGTDAYGIEIINDSPVADGPLPIGFVDVAKFACSPSSIQSCTPNSMTLPNGNEAEMGFRMSLLGDASTLALPHVSSDPTVWNGFLRERSLALSFRIDDLAGVTAFATVSTFSVVPEPQTIGIFTISIVAFSIFGSRTPRRRENGC